MNREKFREMYDLLMEQLDVSRELSDDEILGVIDELILTCLLYTSPSPRDA